MTLLDTMERRATAAILLAIVGVVGAQKALKAYEHSKTHPPIFYKRTGIQPGQPDYIANKDNPPQWTDVDDACGVPHGTNGPIHMEVIPGTPNATAAVNRYNNCHNPGGLPTLDQAAAQVGLTPHQLAGAAVVIGSFNGGGGHGLPIDDRSGPEKMVPRSALSGKKFDPAVLGEKQSPQQQPSQPNH